MCRELMCLAFACVLGLAAVTQADLIGWWTFDEGTGTVAQDYSGNGNNGTFNGSPQWVAGQLGGALQFNGSSHLDCGSSTTLQPAGPITIACWVNPSVLTAQHAFAGRNASYAFKADTTRLRFTTPGILDHSGVNSIMTANTWQHVAATFNPGQAAGLTFYINGVQTDQMTASAMNAGTGPFLIANNQWGEFYTGMIDDVQVYNEILPGEMIAKIMMGLKSASLAGEPVPEDQAVDVLRDVVLSWKAGETAATHDVYLGTSFNDVNDASRSSTLNVLVSQDQTAAEYDPDGLLEYGQTYYWRIDEVNGAPDYTVFKGDVWSFTVETFSYQLTGVTATASSNQTGMGPENTVNGSGLDAQDQHSTSATQMWMTNGAKPAWIQFEFDKAYKLDKMLVWNSNQVIEGFLGFGAKTVTVECSTDGQTWTPLENVPEFAKATGTATYTANTTVDFARAEAKFVKLTIEANWGGVAPQTGLSEVRFFYIPVQAFEPTPADSATGVVLNSELNWRPGREATSHEVFFGTDANAVAEGAGAAETVTNHRYTPSDMEFGTVYYWKVNEVGDAGTYEGSVWSFTSEEFAPIDDFESYNDDIDAGTTIFQTWIDGVTTGASGSTVGYFDAPFAETTVVHGGKQSMPLAYNNTASPFFSEAEREFDPVQNWTTSGADTLSVWVHGNAVRFMLTAADAITMSSTSGDVWTNVDHMRLVYKELTGDGTIIARVDSMTNTAPWAKAGVMIRENLEVASPHALMMIAPDGRTAFQNRPLRNNVSYSAHSNPGAVAFPCWVKLERKGNLFTAWYSTDGVTWTLQGNEGGSNPASPNPQTINMPPTVYIGLAVTSNNLTMACVAEFTGIKTTGNVTSQWQSADIGPAIPGNDPDTFYVTVTDSAGKSATATDATAVTTTDWTQWKIPTADLAGVNLAKVKKLVIGVGKKAAPAAAGAGMVFIDDIGFGRAIE